MKPILHFPVSTFLSTLLLWIGLQPISFAQIVPDSTLPENSRVTSNGSIYEITGGTTAGGNLFHSFNQFSLLAGETAFFNNALTITNIIARVTGSSASVIDGLIQANGSANLFLLNPNGIYFGPNAQLNIGGSFIGSTADRLRFEDGTVFDARTPQTAPLLSIHTPIGLQFGQTPGLIRLQGSGHNLGFDRDTLTVQGDRPAGLEVAEGRTFALIGGELVLEGGNVTAPAGNVEFGSVGSNATVSLRIRGSGWAADYSGVDTFADIRLSQAASVDVSGDRGGDIQIQAQRLTLTDGSALIAQTFDDDGPGGRINIRTRESVRLGGGTRATAFNPNPFPTAILVGTEEDSDDLEGRLRIETEQLQLLEDVFLSAIGDDLDEDETSVSQRFSGSLSAEQGRRLILRADQFYLAEGLLLERTASGNGNNGRITLDARTISLGEPLNSPDTIISPVSPPASGQTGNLPTNPAQPNSLDSSSASTASTFVPSTVLAPTSVLSESSIPASSIPTSLLLTSSLPLPAIEAEPPETTGLGSPEVDTTQDIVDLPSDTLNASTQINPSCERTPGSFVITGRGGIPDDPAQSLRGSSTWDDLRLGAVGTQSSRALQSQLRQSGQSNGPAGYTALLISHQRTIQDRYQVTLPPVQPITEVQHWVRTEQGTIRLIAAASAEASLAEGHQNPICHR